MKTHIFCRTYAKDREWLFWMLYSLDKFARGFEPSITVEYPSADAELVCGCIPSLHNFEINHKPKTPRCADGYLDQQISKLYSDETIGCGPEDLIFFIDSDTFVKEPITPHQFLENGLPVIWMENYDRLPKDVPWKEITSKACGFDVTMEFMRRFPFVYPAWHLENVRWQMDQVHGIGLDGYISRQPKSAFSEFNLLGAMAYQAEKLRLARLHPSKLNDFVFKDVAIESPPPSPLIQSWSHGGISEEHRAFMTKTIWP